MRQPGCYVSHLTQCLARIAPCQPLPKPNPERYLALSGRCLTCGNPYPSSGVAQNGASGAMIPLARFLSHSNRDENRSGPLQCGRLTRTAVRAARVVTSGWWSLGVSGDAHLRRSRHGAAMAKPGLNPLPGVRSAQQAMRARCHASRLSLCGCSASPTSGSFARRDADAKRGRCANTQFNFPRANPLSHFVLVHAFA